MSPAELYDHLKSLVENSVPNNGAEPEKGFLTVAHAAVYSDLSEESIRRLYESGKLTALRPVRGRILIERKELDAYIKSCTATPRKGRGRRSAK